MLAALLLVALGSAAAPAPAAAPTNATDPSARDMTTCCAISTSFVPATSAPVTYKKIKMAANKLPPKGKADSPMLNYIFDSYATSNKHFHDKFRAPKFEETMESGDAIVDADSGATVYFDCKVSSLRDKMVSWIRVGENDNLELLTLDLDTHTSDGRYRVDLTGDNWKLELTDAKVDDTGMYGCHVSTHPPMLRRVKLTVHPPLMKLGNEAFLETGETLSLKCSIVHLSVGHSTPTIHWVRGNSTVPLDEVRGGVLIETDHLKMTSSLQVSHLKMEDAGNYTCLLLAPVYMRATTRVHVLQGSSLAELQSGVKNTSVCNLLTVSVFFVLCKSIYFLDLGSHWR